MLSDSLLRVSFSKASAHEGRYKGESSTFVALRSVGLVSNRQKTQIIHHKQAKDTKWARLVSLMIECEKLVKGRCASETNDVTTKKYILKEKIKYCQKDGRRGRWKKSIPFKVLVLIAYTTPKKNVV